MSDGVPTIEDVLRLKKCFKKRQIKLNILILNILCYGDLIHSNFIYIYFKKKYQVGWTSPVSLESPLSTSHFPLVQGVGLRKRISFVEEICYL